MATAGEMTRMVSEALSVPYTEASSYFRVLRDKGLMTSGGRGRSAPAMTSLDASRLTICLMSAEALAQGFAATELVGGLMFAGTIEAEKLHLLDEHPTDETADDWSDVRPEEWSPERPNFEEALAALIELAAQERVRGKLPRGWSLGAVGDWFPGAPDGRVRVSVTPTALQAHITGSGLSSYFVDENATLTTTHPDYWTTMPIEERMRARAMISGMSVTRTISETELFWLSAAVTVE